MAGVENLSALPLAISIRAVCPRSGGEMISVNELTKTFEVGGREILAVDRLTFSVGAGEVYGLLGPNGAGKTTTVRMILGLLRPTSGYAEVDGLRSSEAPDEVKRRVGLVSASAGVYQWLTPREMLLFFADLYGLSPETAKRQLAHVSEVMGLTRFLDQRSSTLSTGQKQRVQLARALIHNPPIMLLDEPTRGLDVFGSQAIFDYIAKLREDRRAVIVCTHRLHEAERLCDRFGLMHRGRLVLEGTLAELQQSTGCETLVEMFMKFVGDSSIDTTTEYPAA
jgi:ABC-2 type transport system ATP-binding protein/sodium transport system ATP-binding protein